MDTVEKPPKKTKKTAEELAEISRRNGAKSRGPKTIAGKLNSRRSRLRHGMRAEVLIMEDEDPDMISDLYNYWTGYYNPKSPGTNHLLDICVRSKLMMDRCVRAHDSAVATATEFAGQAFDAARIDMITEHEELLAVDPVEGEALLTSTGLGCLLLVSRLEQALASLLAQGRLPLGACAEVIRMLGAFPEPERLKDSSVAYIVTLNNLACQPGGAPAELAVLSRPEFRPPALAHDDLSQHTRVPADCRRRLQSVLEERIAGLRSRAEALSEGRDQIERSRTVAPTLLIEDDKEGRLFFRYFGTANSTFVRALKALQTTLASDAKAAAEGLDKAGETASEPGPGTPEAVLPFEPGHGQEQTAEVSNGTGSSVDSEGAATLRNGTRKLGSGQVAAGAVGREPAADPPEG